MKDNLTAIVRRALEIMVSEGRLPGPVPIPRIEVTRDRKFGDYATGIAMIMGKETGVPPRELAGEIAGVIRAADREREVDDVSVAGPGFINMTMSQGFWNRILKSVLQEKGDFLRTGVGAGKRVQVEFVSANPTGPLHVGHGRGAALGDALASILECCGYEVEREYYINDAGNQIQTLGRSVFARYLQAFGKDVPFPEEGYRGDYIGEIAREIKEREKDRYLGMDEDRAVSEIADLASRTILEDIRSDLEEFGVRFDRWFSESKLLEAGRVRETLDDLEKRGFIFRLDGAVWFHSTQKGDDKDRVMVKSDGSLTYFASDVAYHRDKFERGFDKVVDIWGADHHGYVPRMKAAVEALGRDRDDLTILLLQLVNLLRKGKPVAMSTRAGEFVTLREVREEVGRDAARFIFLTRKADSKLDFDLDLAKERSNDNPVYYVQYAHARICSILRNAAEKGVAIPLPGEVDPSLLVLPEERELIRSMAALPEVVETAALAMEPHRVTIWLRDISTILHSYYFRHRVLSEDPALTNARIALVVAVRFLLSEALSLLGVSAPERM
ncbi:MAG: arginine--tRNA ligase [Proteobacteria bacterium]|nr:arginine--tRNA ligase [Pseudomonadota bacterium]